MVTTKVESHHKRKGASCMQCERLHTSCRLKDKILSETEVHANYAAEGCGRFKCEGVVVKVKAERENRGGSRDYYTNRDINKSLRQYLISGKPFKTTDCATWGIDKPRLHNNITMLKKQGYEVEKTKIPYIRKGFEYRIKKSKRIKVKV